MKSWITMSSAVSKVPPQYVQYKSLSNSLQWHKELVAHLEGRSHGRVLALRLDDAVCHHG